ncbi:MAG: AAA family ATPase [Gammaproteobacteria bacterium]|nr:AAA family ATPase [Gammaproteobacteria bacterium]
MIDLALLRIIKHKEQFDKVARYIPSSAIDKRTKAVVEDIKKYFKENPEETQISMPAFRSLFFTVYHKGMKDESIDFYNKLLTRMEVDESESITKNLINRLLELEYATSVANRISSYEAGDDINIITEVDALTDKVKHALERSNGFEYIAFSEDAVEIRDDDSGYKWPLECMNKVYRNIGAGDQYIIAARPGLGKTTFITHLNYSMSQDMDPNKIIVWFNNESRKERIMQRTIQSAIGCTNKELYALHSAGTLRQKYSENMGNAERVRVYDIHGKNNYQLEEILESVGVQNVGAIVFDMLDNVRFPTNKELREDQRLEQLYQWSRELGVRYNCPTFPTSQVSNEGAGELFPTENMLKDSKTGKQGACDGIVVIGWNDDPTTPDNRGIAMPKTKSKREGQQNLREVVLFDADRGRYIG